MVDGGLSYEDDDRRIVLNELRERLEMLESERITRLPVTDRSPDWEPTGCSSDIRELSDSELASDVADHRAMVRQLESLDLATASPKTRREIGRRAYQLRMHYEGVRLLSVVGDRTRYEAGFSPDVRFDGRRQLIGEPARLASFGTVNWRETLQSWRVLNDPDRAPVRLPGFVCAGGIIHKPNALTPEEYSDRFALFRLAEYADSFGELVGDRRCQHCLKPLSRATSERRLYCGPQCSQTARQKRHRMCEKRCSLGV